MPKLTTDDILSLMRPNIRNITPYRSARDDYHSGILLDANENAFGHRTDHPLPLHRYPAPLHPSLRQKIAHFRGVEADQVFLGVGSDEPIDLLIRMFCTPARDSIIITPPTYGMYSVSASINDVGVHKVPLTTDFQLQPDRILEEATTTTPLLFLCSPNNPTGNSMDEKDLLMLINTYPGIVIIDEAYIDFSERKSFAQYVKEYPNLVILQTLSKSFGLAGARIGIALASDLVVSYMNRIKAPYNINRMTANVAEQALDRSEAMSEMVTLMKIERARLIEALSKIPTVRKIYPTDANFILIKMDNAEHIYRELPHKGVVIRYRGDQLHCEDTLRITVGTPEENDYLLEQLNVLA